MNHLTRVLTSAAIAVMVTGTGLAPASAQVPDPAPSSTGAADDPAPAQVPGSTATPTPSPTPSQPEPEPNLEPGPQQRPESAPDPGGPTSPEPSTTPALVAPEPAPGDPTRQTVTYGAYSVTVPADWPVLDLAAAPTTCVRYDVHAVYLGVPGADQTCPTGLRGRTEALLVGPAPQEAATGTHHLAAGQRPELTATATTAGEFVVAVDDAAVTVTATFGDDPTEALDILGSGVASAPRTAQRSAAPSILADTTAAAVPQLSADFTRLYGRAFDACAAPSWAAMQAWRASTYQGIGIYIGGSARSCAQANLTTDWVRGIAAIGWKALPIYVGRQAPCTSFTSRIDPGQEWAQGREAALDAIGRAQALGIGPGSDIYYDMESYTQSSSCSGSVRAYLSSWTSTLQFNGYSSGVYSSLTTGIEDLANGAAQPGFVPPDKIWLARWNNTPNVYGHAPYVADSQWSPYRRVHQFQGGHNETWNGVTINIDSNVVDTDPNRGSPTGQLDSLTTQPGKILASGWALDPDTTAPVIVQMYIGSQMVMVSANQPRPDIGLAYPAAGPNHGFTMTAQVPAGTHQVCVFAVNVGPGTTRTLSCSMVTVAPAGQPLGGIDALVSTPGVISAGGWALDPSSTSTMIVQMYLETGARAMVAATAPRSDLAAAFPAAGANHGYSVTIPASAGRHNACLYAINPAAGLTTPLGCRSVVVADGTPFGQVDAVGATSAGISARGWAIDPKTSKPVIVQMYLDGRSYTMASASGSRPDVAAAYPAAGPLHGFSLFMPASTGRHDICLFAVDSSGGPAGQLGCRSVVVPDGSPFGQIDSVGGSPGTVTASGWAIDPDTSNPIMVQMYVDGRANGVAWANASRPDVGQAYPAAGSLHGYTISLGAARGSHTACLYAINTGPGTSTPLGCRPVVVP